MTYHHETHSFRLMLDNTEGLYSPLQKQIRGVLDEGHHIRTLENYLGRLWEALTGWGRLNEFTKSLIDEPNFAALAREYLDEAKAERKVQAS